jgi:hypothetical protein
MRIAQPSSPLHNQSANSLVAKTRALLDRLEEGGWGALLRAHGFDPAKPDLEAELLRPLPGIDRALAGFSDFASDGVRAIEPGEPARSLLYHALASPQVVQKPDGTPLDGFPTPAEIEVVENLVFGIRPPSIQELRVRAGNAPLAIVVFATEYRPAIGTVHQKHADLCFSRAGVARVGTAPHHYLPDARGYLPFVEGDPYQVRVLPCRYSAYIAAQLPGDAARFGPMRFATDAKGDASRRFWVPLHKLFGGAPCIRGTELTVELTAYYVNEKLRRVHRVLGGEGIDTGLHSPLLDQRPFTVHDGLAALSADPHDGAGLVVPEVHERLVEQAVVDGRPLTYIAPRARPPFRSSVIISSRSSGARGAPEYVHARHRVEDDGQVTDLNNLSEMVTVIESGGYRAIHYLDYTADGSVHAECPQLVLELPRSLPAYSMVAAVDFFPLVKQQELMQWWSQSVPPDLEKNIWPSNPGPPLTLADTRYAANQSLTLEKLDVTNQKRRVFDAADDTMTAVVGLLDSGRGTPTRIDPVVNARAASLPDGASGVFAPGWDTSIDRTDETAQDDGTVLPGVYHFNNYGLGSPFPEDAMLCSALSSFWPAAAPDVTRTFAPGKYATATPLTDDVLGLEGGEPWDGIPGPRIPDPSVNEVEYRTIEYGDYVQAALDNRFNIEAIARTSAAEYAARTLVMARAYTALGAVTREEKRVWAIFSFTVAREGDEDRRLAEAAAGAQLGSEAVYRFRVFRHKPVVRRPRDHRNKLVGFDEMITLFADPRTVLKDDGKGKWVVLRY